MNDELIRMTTLIVVIVGLAAPTNRVGAQQQDQSVEPKMQPVVIAKRDLEMGTKPSREDFSIEQWPAAIVPVDAVSSLEDMDGKLLRYRIRKHSPLYESDLVPYSEKLPIPLGFKVVAVKVKANQAIYELIIPGSLVDVYAIKETTAGSAFSSVLHNVRAFSIAVRQDWSKIQNSSETKENDEIIVGVLVTDQQAEELILRQSEESKFAIVLTSTLTPFVGEETAEISREPTIDPDSGSPTTERERLVSQWREMARKLDDQAADLEDSGQFELSDELRSAADKLRGCARKLVLGQPHQ